MTQQTFYDSPHPNLEHDLHSTHTLSVIPYPHLSYCSHDESCHTSFVSNVLALSFKFVIFPSWLCFTLTNCYEWNLPLDRGSDLEGRWLQLVRCAYPLVMSLYFGYAKIWVGNPGIDFQRCYRK